MRIVCLAPDASTNSVVRLYPIAKALAQDHEVTIVGFRSGPDVFAPYRHELECYTVRAAALPQFLRQMTRMAKGLEADALYAFKPLATSLWTGFAARRELGVPLMVDVEDWEIGWYRDRSAIDQLKHLARILSPNSYAWTALNESMLRFADRRFVVSRFLQRRFGGTLLRHGADTTLFDPARWDRERALDELGLPDRRYVVFTGSPQPSKGLDDLLEAMRLVEDRDLHLLLIGSFAHMSPYVRTLQDRFSDIITVLPAREHREMPMVLALADVVALPQRRTRQAEAQVPGKVFEAMSMARPIVATAISDLPEILEGCGRIVPPEQPDALARELERLIHEPEAAATLGTAARKRCEAEFSWTAMRDVLNAELEGLDTEDAGTRSVGDSLRAAQR